MSSNESILSKKEKENDSQYCDRIEKHIADNPDNRDMQMQYADILIDSLIDGTFIYSDKNLKQIIGNDLFRRCERIVKKMNPVSPIHCAIIDFLNGKNASLFKHIEKWVEQAEQTNINDIVFNLLVPLKNGFPGMWTSIKRIVEPYNNQEGLSEFCDALEIMFHSGDNDLIVDSLCNVIAKNKEIYVAYELLGFTYYQAKMWKNAIAYIEKITDADYYSYFPTHFLHLIMAWSYGKTRNFAKEESYYRAVLSIMPDSLYTTNDLGLSLYKQKRFQEAKDVFLKLVEQRRDLPYSANNLVRTILALGNYQEAVSFIDSYDGKISKELVSKSIALSKSNVANKAFPTIELGDSDEDGDIEYSIKTDTETDIWIKREQFSSEKLLEDELTARLEKGFGAFGLPLVIHERRGEYGRQFPLGDGRRIDILAVDRDGNYYVIELKKDSGYGDVFAQITDYIKWVERNMATSSTKVYGIICLNSPSKKLIKQVQSNSQIRLFEYAIAYNEIK